MSFNGAAMHTFVRGLGEARICFPALKEDIIRKCGRLEVQVADDKFEELAEIIKMFEPDYYENGTAFMCAYTSAMTQEARKTFVSKQ